MTQGRGFKNLPPPSQGAPAPSKDDELEWGEASEEELFDRPTLIPDILPTEADLMRSASLSAQRPTPVPPPAEQPSQVVPKASLNTDPSSLEFDLGNLAPATVSPQQPPRARPITVPNLPPARPPSSTSTPGSTSGRLMQPLRPPSTNKPPSAPIHSAPTPPARPAVSAPSRPTSSPRNLPAQPPAQPPTARPASSSRNLPAEPPPPARASAPFTVDLDPLFEDLDNPPRVSNTDDFDDFDKLRDPKLKSPAPAPHQPIPSSDNPKTAPYPLDDWELDKSYVAGQLRQPPPVAAATTPIEDPVSSEPRRANRPLMGETRSATLSPSERMLREMRDKFALGDFSGSLKAAEDLLALEADNPEAGRFADNCRNRLRGMFEAKLGSLSRVPRVVLPPDQIRWLSLDHRSGFILSCVDGYSSIEEILDVCGMPALDALRILHDLLQQRVIAV